MPILQVTCSGSPYEIGHAHGHAAKSQIAHSISFYTSLFKESSNKDWAEVRELARGFEEVIRREWERYWEEMRGVADGSGNDLLDIIALNVRTEITFGLFTDNSTAPLTSQTQPSSPPPLNHSLPHPDHLDGCTSLSLLTPRTTYLGQNWDWSPAQSPSLILLHITPLPPYPSLKIVTEAGIIGKIGLNSLGVGVLFNAIRARGMDPSRMPAHLGLRRALECASAREVEEVLGKVGLASSAHLMVADAGGGGAGLEFSATTCEVLRRDGSGVLCHSNHLLLRHDGVDEPAWLADSCGRVERIRVLAGELLQSAEGGGRSDDGGDISLQQFQSLFDDHAAGPGSICRRHSPPTSTSATLFNIVMDLAPVVEGNWEGKGKSASKAIVTIGRLCEGGEVIELVF